MRKTRAIMSSELCRYLISGLVVLGAQAWAGAPLNTLRDLKVQPTSSGARVVVAGTRAPTFTVFRLADPDRLIVDVSSADVSQIRGPHAGQGPVGGVVASQFSDERASVGRLLVALNGAAQYDVHAEGTQVVIAVQGGNGAAADAAPVTAADPAPRKEPAAAAAPPRAPSEPNVVSSEGNERRVAHPAHHVIGVAFRKDGLALRMDGEASRYQLLRLKDPPRIALDVFGVTLATHLHHPKTGPFATLRAGAHDDRVRLVVDVDGSMPEPAVEWAPRGLSWTLAPPADRSVAAASSAPEADGDAELVIDGQRIPLSTTTASAETSRLKVKPEPAAPQGPRAQVAEVRDLTFVDSEAGGRVQLKLSGQTDFTVERPDAQSAVLVLAKARLPKRLERSLDTSALGTPVKMVSAFAVPGSEDKVRVVVAAEGALDERVERTPEGLSWHLSAKGVKTEAVAVNVKTAGFTSEAVSYAAEGAPRRTEYSGKKVSFEFKDIDIHNLLRVIAEVSKRNVVVSDDVSGKVTIRLRNVPWDQALELILRSKGLGKEEIGNIIRVAPLSTLEHEAQARAARKAALVKQEDLKVQLIPVNYAKADDVKDRLKEVLSERGSVSTDTRTNVLIVRDISSAIEKARALVQNLDLPTPQVQIESRIVEANTTFTRQIGVQWGGVAQAAQGTNNATGLIFPNTVRVGGGVDPSGAPTNGVLSTPNFAVNLPAAVGNGSGGALGFIFGSAGGALQLNLRLSALENEGQIKTISAPKVTTLDNHVAKVSQGLSIPFSQVSAQGVNTVFIEARLSLEVTPHITQDGSVLMTIHAENNQPDPANTGANGQPAIQRKEANTQVLVKDGDTTVIGGIYVRVASTSVQMVPWLGRIPILGFFFRTDTENENRQEMLIFITPRILNRQALAQTGAL